VVEGPPAAGRRTRAVTSGFAGTEVHHTIYLPEDWRPGGSHPVLVEFPGNGNYRNEYGDSCDGTVEGCNLGYGLSGGRGCIWICVPLVEVAGGTKRNCVTWWGDVAETVRYCVATVRETCARYGGDARRVVLCGFSRGAIACNYIGLHDDEIAGLWRGFIAHSHYDGVKTYWPYAGADRAAAGARLARLRDRAQLISHEGSTDDVEQYLAGTDVAGRFTFLPIPFRNHSDAWTLRDLPERRRARDWLRATLD
jgi:hypothetical protein